MRILVDENLDRPIVLHLRELGHDVTQVSELSPGATDEWVITCSRREHRVLITQDRDMGRLLMSDIQPHPGVIYLRLQGVGEIFWRDFQDLWPKIELIAPGHFVTVKKQQIRRRPIPLRPAALS